MPNSWHDSIVDTGLLCCVAICLMGVGHMDTGVIQNPNFLVKESGETVVLSCDPIKGHTYIYWYQQLMNKEFKFLVYRTTDRILDDSEMPKDRYSTEWLTGLPSTLKIQRLEPEDSALYLCASSPWSGGGQQYFGKGSQLTVVDDLTRVTPPKVTVFQPSEEEMEEKGKATLVCLATGFYPDLVELRWWVNGQETQIGVSTDPQPSKEQPSNNFSTYSLSSRLRVSAPFWRNPKNSFRCQVLFNGISENEPWTSNRSKPITQNVSDQIWGKADCGVTSESYQRSIQSATFFYEILLGKAMLYGLLVSALVWRTMAKKKHS